MTFSSTKNITEKLLKDKYPDYYKEMMDFIIDDELPISEKIWLFQNNLKSIPKCINCENDVKFIKFYKGYRKYCSKSCSAIDTHKDVNIKNARLTNMLSCNYDKDLRKEMTEKSNITKSNFDSTKRNEINQKRGNTNFEKYGVYFISQSDDIKNKIKNKFIEKYGVSNPLKLDKFKNKYKETCLLKYGVDHYSKTTHYREKMMKYFKICNDSHYIESIGNSIYKFKCDKDHCFEINSDNYLQRTKSNNILCTICYPIGDQKSIKEIEVFNFIEGNYGGELISGYRDNLEIDIYLPDLKLGFEFNGLYYHSDKFTDVGYHINKTNYFSDKNIRVIHIWEDDWVFKKDIVKSQILNMIGLTNNRIFGRKCKVKEVDVKESREFLDNNHIQGFVKSVKKIGLYYDDELVSLMIFDQFEGRNHMEEGGWNLSRFCNKLNTNVIGGASKLLNYFIKTYNPSRIVSYADQDWSKGDLYYKLGFENVNQSPPDYKYIIKGKRVHKSNFKKSILKTELTESKQMELNGVNKIWDCGKIKFQINF